MSIANSEMEARSIFSRTKYRASDEDVKKLADSMTLLEKRGLDNLNQRLVTLKGHDQIFNALTELNFAMILVSRCPAAKITYEPVERKGNGSPDFKVEMGGVTYWIQVKDLQKLARENRQDNIIREVRKAAAGIKIGKIFRLRLSDGFEQGAWSKRVAELIAFMKEKAASAADGVTFTFISTDGQEAVVEFFSAIKETPAALTLESSGDRDIVNITGLSKGQIRASFLKAAEVFTWPTDENNINLIAVEADNDGVICSDRDMAIRSVLFGTGVGMHYLDFEGKEICQRSFREPDGLFSDPDFSCKVAGVIVLKRKREMEQDGPLSEDELTYWESQVLTLSRDEIRKTLEEPRLTSPTPVSDYDMALCTRFDSHIAGIKDLLGIEKVTYGSLPEGVK